MKSNLLILLCFVMILGAFTETINKRVNKRYTKIATQTDNQAPATTTAAPAGARK